MLQQRLLRWMTIAASTLAIIFATCVWPPLSAGDEASPGGSSADGHAVPASATTSTGMSAKDKNWEITIKSIRQQDKLEDLVGMESKPMAGNVFIVIQTTVHCTSPIPQGSIPKYDLLFFGVNLYGPTKQPPINSFERG